MIGIMNRPILFFSFLLAMSTAFAQPAQKHRVLVLEAGSYKGNVSIRPYSPNLYDVPVTAPKVDKPETLYFILQVTDKGMPSLTRYKRVIVTVEP
jgi:hypothetical protein